MPKRRRFISNASSCSSTWSCNLIQTLAQRSFVRMRSLITSRMEDVRKRQGVPPLHPTGSGTCQNEKVDSRGFESIVREAFDSFRLLRATKRAFSRWLFLHTGCLRMIGRTSPYVAIPKKRKKNKRTHVGCVCARKQSPVRKLRDLDPPRAFCHDA